MLTLGTRSCIATASGPNTDDRPTKRARTDPEAITYKRHETHYHDDGNVILISSPEAPDDKTGEAPNPALTTASESTLFRLHRSILSKRSGFFKDLFLVPQPDDAETFDGCGVVQLSESTEEVVCLADLLYGDL